MPLHHVAYATKDCEATRHFYEDLMGFPLLYTETTVHPETGSWLRHLFFDIGPDDAGNTEAMAFFEVHNVGEQPGYTTDVSDGVGLPVWVNHVAFRATEEMQAGLRERMTAAGIEPLMDMDHGWCHSLYYVDPNGIMVEFCRDTPGFTPNPEEARRLLTADPLANAMKVR
jgi:catechol 2,3-dioxygenase-like lactoylglutathione lyase family enzyme